MVRILGSQIRKDVRKKFFRDFIYLVYPSYAVLQSASWRERQYSLGFDTITSTMHIAVVVHPNAKKEKIEKDLLDTLHVYVHEPPLEGKANRAVCEALAAYFHTKKGNVLLIRGMKSKYKTFEILEY